MYFYNFLLYFVLSYQLSFATYTRCLERYGHPHEPDCWSALRMLDRQASPIVCGGLATLSRTSSRVTRPPRRFHIEGGILKKAPVVALRNLDIVRWSTRMQFRHGTIILDQDFTV